MTIPITQDNFLFFGSKIKTTKVHTFLHKAFDIFQQISLNVVQYFFLLHNHFFTYPVQH